MTRTVHLGYAVGTGEPVAVPLAHTFVTGQTQLSGKTETLRALVERAGCPALAFSTKRGEQLGGLRHKPYLPREGKEPIHWRLVETILASALGQRAMKYERYWLIQAAKGATSLAGVRDNVIRLLKKAKGGRTEEAYTLILEYLDLVVPEMNALDATDRLDLSPGLNVMDLSAVGPQLQALVIRAALERINRHEKGVLTVFPEAWEFAPRGRSAPAKDEAIAMARKGAVLRNYLLCDSQDIAGVDTAIRQATSVWILGVQRELNELKRPIDSIPAGIAKPKPADVATLGLGQFFACWGRHCVKTYVQPVWVPEELAVRVARGEVAPEEMNRLRPGHDRLTNPERVNRFCERFELQPAFPGVEPPEWLDQYPPPTPPLLDSEDLDMADVTRLEEKLDKLLSLAQQPPNAVGVPATGPVGSPATAADEEGLYQRFKARLLADAPELLQVLVARPEIVVKVQRQVIEVGDDSLRGKLALLIKQGFFDEGRTGYAAWKELERLGSSPAKVSVYTDLKELARMGFLTKEGEGYRTAPGMKDSVKEKR